MLVRPHGDTPRFRAWGTPAPVVVVPVGRPVTRVIVGQRSPFDGHGLIATMSALNLSVAFDALMAWAADDS